jgi:hypothetical protein
MRRDRCREPVDDEDQDVDAEVHRCDRGWLDRDADHPRPGGRHQHPTLNASVPA